MKSRPRSNPKPTSTLNPSPAPSPGPNSAPSPAPNPAPIPGPDPGPGPGLEPGPDSDAVYSTFHNLKEVELKVYDGGLYASLLAKP